LSILQKANNQSESIEESYIGRIFDTRKDIAPCFKEEKLPEFFPTQSFQLSSTESQDAVIIDTLVHVYKQYELRRGTSSLTLPYQMQLNQEAKGKTMSFTYWLKPQIELKYQLNNTN